ncbi:MAG TPA: hypothetical protein VGE31_03285 [Candidatus Paceibacterota bacterium]
MSVSPTRLKELAREYLSTKGQNDIANHLNANEEGLAQRCLLQGIGQLNQKGEIDPQEAQRVYRELGL